MPKFSAVRDTIVIGTVRVEDLRTLLSEAAAQFRSYAQGHRAKETVDGDAKANVNEQWAERMDKTLAGLC